MGNGFEHPISAGATVTRHRDVARAIRARVCILWIVLVAGCERPSDTTHLVGSTMGTEYSAKIAASVPEQAAELQADIDALLTTITETMSTYDESSELSKINQSAATDWITVSDPLLTVLEAALEVNEASSGAFDITVGALVNEWGFGPSVRGPEPPEQAHLQNLLQTVGAKHLQLRKTQPAVKKAHKAVTLDLSGIAKGYAVDEVARLLENRGYEDFMVEIGGEVRASGVNDRGLPWRIAVERPEPGAVQFQGTIGLVDQAMATSGNYRNFYERAGVRYGHTIDPRTGAPTTHGLSAVTVIHASTMYADAWATALMSAGLERGLKLAHEHDIAALFFVLQADKVTVTETPAAKLAIGNNTGTAID